MYLPQLVYAHKAMPFLKHFYCGCQTILSKIPPHVHKPVYSVLCSRIIGMLTAYAMCYTCKNIIFREVFFT